jgi:hypothetical protein
MSIRSAAIAVGFVDRPDWPRMRLLDFRPRRKGELLGFARLEFPISDIPILAGPKGVFAALPAKPIPDGEGRQKREAVNGNLPCGRQVIKDTYSKKTIRAHLACITGGLSMVHPEARTRATWGDQPNWQPRLKLKK